MLIRQQYANELTSDLIDNNAQRIRQKDFGENYQLCAIIAGEW